jgi:hypothetical protein
LALVYVLNQTKEICFEAVQQNPEAFAYMDTKFLDIH